jgi:hypothetical protein
MREVGADGSHLGWTSRKFAGEYLAPLIMHNEAARPRPRAHFKESRSEDQTRDATDAGVKNTRLLPVEIKAGMIPVAGSR